MNCNDINRALVQGSLAASSQSEVDAHLSACAQCRNLVSGISSPLSDVQPSASDLARVESLITTDLRPVKPVPPSSYFLAGVLTMFVGMVALAAMRLGPFAIEVMTPVQTVAILCALAIAAGSLAYSLVNQIFPGSRHWISPRFLPIGVAVALAIVISILFQFHHEQNFWANSWTCIRTGASIGALTSIPLWLILRRGAILSPGMTGAAAGALAGLTGMATLEIHCPNLNAWHILTGHLGVIAIGAIAGLTIGTGLSRLNRRSSDSAAAF
jgi:hypothetical protein